MYVQKTNWFLKQGNNYFTPYLILLQQDCVKVGGIHVSSVYLQKLVPKSA